MLADSRVPLPLSGSQVQGAGWRGIRRLFRRYPLGGLGAVLLVCLGLVALLAPWVARYDPLFQDAALRLRPPGGDFWFGTDTYGRDIFSRVVWGSRVSLFVGVASVMVGTVPGVLLGVCSAYFGDPLDLVLQRVFDALLGFPSLVLSIIIVVGLGPSINTVTVAIAIALVPRMARLARSSALAVREEMYVLAARAAGSSDLRIVLQHILPNCLAPVFVLATGYLGSAIVAEASLSFLGLGVPPPEPSWGGLLQFGARGYVESAPWLTVFPGLALSSATFAFVILGDALRDTLDPRLRGS
ncbi:MAG: ABC transporter permease [Chloroflexota bacterium]